MTLWVTLPLAVGCWGGLYFLLRRSYPHLGAEWMCRVITLIHALVIVPSCAYSAFKLGPSPFTDPGGPNTDYQNAIILVSLSYFVFDFAWSLASGTEGPVLMAHHVLSIFGNWITIVRGTCGTEMLATLFGAELSGPFLQMRYFLRFKEVHRTWYGELNDVVFMLIFGFMRTVVGSYFMYCYLPHPGPDWLAKSGGFMLYIMGWFWWLAMLRYAYRKYTKMYREYMSNKKKNGQIDNNVTPSDKEVSATSNGTAHMSNGDAQGIKSKEE